MLATFIIGLREGLEAALIVGIIAAFLRNNQKSLVPMWIGVILAILLSIAVGVGLKLVERALPQTQQEALESVIGVIAVIFVTGMILWMNTHARQFKKKLEADAQEALSKTGAYALASMAFLAVLKEGFETSVFLLATFSSAQSASLAVLGAVIGLLLSAVIGWGIYLGGIKFNLSKFFRYTGLFLILVAAGLVLNSLRTAHEAGWLIAGQQLTFDLSWLVHPGTVQSALITGVLGIPADPRLVEVIGWLLYLVGVSLWIFWPEKWRPQGKKSIAFRFAIALLFCACAALLYILYPRPAVTQDKQVQIVDVRHNQPLGTMTLVKAAPNATPTELQLALDDASSSSLSFAKVTPSDHHQNGMLTQQWFLKQQGVPEDRPTTLTIQDILTLNHGRFPVGINPNQNPGPFNATWKTLNHADVWLVHNWLLDAEGENRTLLTLTDGGLATPRTIRVDTVRWQLSDAARQQAIRQLQQYTRLYNERQLWAIQLPILFLILAAGIALQALRKRASLRKASPAKNLSF